MLNRRKMFSAIMAAGGVSAVLADHAVAMTFDDADYLRERGERLAAHAAEMDRIDTARRATEIKAAAALAVVDRYWEQAVRAMADDKRITLTMPYADFELLHRRNMIDIIPSVDGEKNIPVFLSQPIKVT